MRKLRATSQDGKKEKISEPESIWVGQGYSEIFQGRRLALILQKITPVKTK